MVDCLWEMIEDLFWRSSITGQASFQSGLSVYVIKRRTKIVCMYSKAYRSDACEVLGDARSMLKLKFLPVCRKFDAAQHLYDDYCENESIRQ